MKKTRQELELIKSFVDNTYNRFGQRLLVNTSKVFNPCDPGSALGFCFKFVDPTTKSIVYEIECSRTNLEYTDFRIMMHEYGHIYLGHLDGQYELLDQQVYSTIENHREELVEEINAKCGIDFADKLLNRVIDDPYLNHTLHNIAMDMEVNSKVLSLEDIDEIEMDLTSLVPDEGAMMLKDIRDRVDDEDVKKNLDEAIKKSEAEAKVKLIHPFRYYTDVDENGEGIPFPTDLSYIEYLILIIQHLDQFVKMLVSIKMGGNGDTSGITQQDIQDALNNILDALEGKSEAYKQGYRDAVREMQQQLGNGQQGQPSNQQGGQQGQNQGQGQGMPAPGNGSSSQGQPGAQGQQGGGSSGGSGQQGMSQKDQEDYNQGYQDALQDMANSVNGQGAGGMQGLDDLMQQAGMMPGNQGQSGNGSNGNNTDGDAKKSNPTNTKSGSEQEYKGKRFDPNEPKFKDHGTDSRQLADKIREAGQVTSAGGLGCGNSGGSSGFRTVDKDVDAVDMALQEVLRNMKNRVVKVSTKKDNMKNYNRGIVRSVIAPSVSRNVTICNDPKIVFLIDISGSMNTKLVDRCLSTIAISLKKLSRGLRYDIITWNTNLGEHIRDIDPHRPITTVSYGGGTSIALGIKYFKDNYGPESILVIISDFEDYLEEWQEVEATMNEYSIYGFNYGYNPCDKIDWKNLKVKHFKQND